LAGVGGLLLAAEDGRQLAVEFDVALTLLDPLRRRVGPAWIVRSQFVTAAEVGQGLGELPLVPQGIAEVAVGLGVVRLESEGLAELGDGLLQPALVVQGGAQVVVEGGAQVVVGVARAAAGPTCGSPTRTSC
jgi:hypothetical protein